MFDVREPGEYTITFKADGFKETKKVMVTFDGEKKDKKIDE